MTKQERNIVYKAMLHEFECGRVLYGFCGVLGRLHTNATYNDEGYWSISDQIEDYPELVANKPLEITISGYWFLPEYLGRSSKRIEILRSIIAETNENGN